MTYGTGNIISFMAFVGIVIVCLFGISQIRHQKVNEGGHLILSFVPWGHVVISYAVAVYVRIGFGAWPRSCLDNPDLPLLKGLVTAIALGVFFVLYFLPPAWIGWLVIRWRRGMKKAWLFSTIVFLTGSAMELLLLLLDPGKFWDWVWD
jgi:hypothetical protein